MCSLQFKKSMFQKFHNTVSFFPREDSELNAEEF